MTLARQLRAKRRHPIFIRMSDSAILQPRADQLALELLQ